jgi:uncharacterized protein YndB with AHSA1/START domain
MKDSITVEIIVNVPIEKAWEAWTDPEHIVRWAFASDDWEAPHATNNVRVGGQFSTTMRAKDKSAEFDLCGEYTAVDINSLLEYTLEGGRRVRVVFKSVDEGTKLTETFEPEYENTFELQRAGWQAILDNYKKQAER